MFVNRLGQFKVVRLRVFSGCNSFYIPVLIFLLQVLLVGLVGLVSIALASGKGGVGKTALTANLGVALARMGKKVLILDADVYMANLAYFININQMRHTLTDVLMGRVGIDQAVYTAPYNLRVVPSGVALEDMGRIDQTQLSKVLGQLLENLDYLFIDAPAGLAVTTITAIRAAQKTILVTTPTLDSVSDVLKTSKIVPRLESENMGVIINMRTNDPTELVAEEITEILQLPLLGDIPLDKEMKTALLRREPLVITSPNSPFSRAVTKIAKKIVEKEKETITKEKPRIPVFSRFMSAITRQTR